MKQYFLIVLVLSFAACNHADNKPVAVKSTPVKQYELGEVVQKQLSSTISLPGELQPFEIVQLYPKVNGFISDVLVDRGSKVRKGQVLIRLEAPEIEQQYLAARSKYLQMSAGFMASKDNYERLVTTSKTAGTVSAHDLTLARSRMLADSAVVEGERANYKSLEATRSYLTVTAPFDGVITERNVHPGALVGPNVRSDDKPMLVLQQEARLRLVVHVPETYNNQLAVNTEVSFTVSTMPGRQFKGVITRTAGAVDLQYRSEAVEADISNKAFELKPGMSAEVQMPVRRSGKPMVVPNSAVVVSTEGKYVVRVQEGRTQHVNILEGNTQNDSTEVFGKLQPGDKVVIHANNEIREGMAINQPGM